MWVLKHLSHEFFPLKACGFKSGGISLRQIGTIGLFCVLISGCNDWFQPISKHLHFQKKVVLWFATTMKENWHTGLISLHNVRKYNGNQFCESTYFTTMIYVRKALYLEKFVEVHSWVTAVTFDISQHLSGVTVESNMWRYYQKWWHFRPVCRHESFGSTVVTTLFISH